MDSLNTGISNLSTESVPKGRLEVVKNTLRLLELKGYCRSNFDTCYIGCTDQSIDLHSDNANGCTTVVVRSFQLSRNYEFTLCDRYGVFDTTTLRTKGFSDFPPEVELEQGKVTGRKLEIKWRDDWKEDCDGYIIRYFKKSNVQVAEERREQLCTIAVNEDREPLEPNTDYEVQVHAMFREEKVLVGKDTFKTKDSWEMREYVIKANLEDLWSQICCPDVRYPEKTRLLNRFSSFFEFALIWDTLINEDKQCKPTDCGQIYKPYLILRKDDEMHTYSMPCPKDLTEGRIAVTYISKIYGPKTFHKTVNLLDIARSLDGFSLQEIKFQPENQQFRSPKLECPLEIQDLIDERIEKEAEDGQPGVEAKIQELKEERECFARMIQYFWEDKPFVEGLKKKIVQQISHMRRNIGPLDLRRYSNFYFEYKRITEGCEPLKEYWERFLNGVCDYYDKFLCETKHPVPAEHENGKNCEICRKRSRSHFFLDDRSGEKYQLEDKDSLTQDKTFCSITNIIYLIVCSKCSTRYVGKTEKSLKVRYRKGKSEEKKHFKLPGHEKIFHIIQVVDEEGLMKRDFEGNESLQDFLCTSKLDLEGIEHIWIERLINRTKDLNKQFNFSYGERHRRRMEGLLRNFFSEHSS